MFNSIYTTQRLIEELLADPAKLAALDKSTLTLLVTALDNLAAAAEVLASVATTHK
jgi:hypothetical protein